MLRLKQEEADKLQKNSFKSNHQVSMTRRRKLPYSDRIDLENLLTVGRQHSIRVHITSSTSHQFDVPVVRICRTTGT